MGQLCGMSLFNAGSITSLDGIMENSVKPYHFSRGGLYAYSITRSITGKVRH